MGHHPWGEEVNRKDCRTTGKHSIPNILINPKSLYVMEFEETKQIYIAVLKQGTLAAFHFPISPPGDPSSTL
jgi:hypothetical protein